MGLLTELKRRNVIRVAIAYLIIGWLLAQVSATLESALHMPDWFDTMIITVMLIGFPIALIISWIYELTPEGIKKEKDIKINDSITNATAKKLDYSTIVAALAVVGIFIWQQFGVKELDSKFFENDKVVKITSVIPEKTETLLNIPEINNKSIAVLPFTNMANNPESEPITVGLHDDLLTHISKISALKVISRTSVLRYKDTKKSIAEIAQELGVANILEGGVQKSGNQIRINVQLIDAKTDEHIWAEIFDRELTTSNIFKIQTEISEKIAAALKAELTEQETQSLAKVPTDNLDAYNAYLAGRQRLAKRTSSSLKEAFELFEKATELDPSYALAYVGQADALYLWSGYGDLSKKVMNDKSWPLIQKALDLDPLLAEAHATMAHYFIGKGDYDKAEESFKYSLSLNKNYATTYLWYSNVFIQRGQFNKSLLMKRKAAELDPLSMIIQTALAYDLLVLKRYTEAIEQYKQAIQLDPLFPISYSGLANVYLQTSRFDDAILSRRKAIKLDPGNIGTHLALVDDYFNIKDFENAEKESLTIIEMSPNHDGLIFLNANIANHKGNAAKGVELFSEAIKNNPENKYFKHLFAFFSMKTGDYQSAVNQWDSVYTEIDGKPYDYQSEYWFWLSNYAWALKQIGEDEKSTELFNEVSSLINNIKDTIDLNSVPFYFYAMQDKTEESAQAYKKWIDSGEFSRWWQQRLPYLDEVKKHPVYIQAHKKLMENLKAQRQNLAKLEAEAQTP